MSNKNEFHGPIEELKSYVDACGLKGVWEFDAVGNKHTFRSSIGGVLNWWPSKGTLLFQGKTSAKDDLEAKVLEALKNPSVSSGSFVGVPQPSQRSIFVVHGHDSEARDQLELALHRLGLDPFILMNTSGGGKTIIEALEGQIGRDYSSDFGIALMTPDDIGYAQTVGESKAEPRARQNVVLETGMLLSSLTRSRMAILVKGHLELPSDLQGIIQLRFNDHVREVMPKLCARLSESGIKLDPDKVSLAST